MAKIRLAIVGVGNCASSLLQGLEYYKHVSAGELRQSGRPDALRSRRLPSRRYRSRMRVRYRRAQSRPTARRGLLRPAQQHHHDLAAICRKYGVTVDMGETARRHRRLIWRPYPPERTFVAAQGSAGQYRAAAARERGRSDALLPAGRAARRRSSAMPAPASRPESACSIACRCLSSRTRSGRRNSPNAASRWSATT